MPIQVGLVGTGYAAKLRAEAVRSHPQAELVAVAGHTPETTQEFSHIHHTQAIEAWQELVNLPVDLVIVANANSAHSTIVRAALDANKHVIVEYPLALDVVEAEQLVELATRQKRLLHVEHIELLGGVHQALKAALPKVGTPFFARYVTFSPQQTAPRKWTYDRTDFGFPLMGALSRIHRLTDLFGAVEMVECQTRYVQPDPTVGYFSSCLCNAQLHFQSGLLAEVMYGKGEAIWQAERSFHIHGSDGALIVNGDSGEFIGPAGREALTIGTRRGLFTKDLELVIAHLTTGAPLYVSPQASLAALNVADAARRSSESGAAVRIREARSGMK